MTQEQKQPPKVQVERIELHVSTDQPIPEGYAAREALIAGLAHEAAKEVRRQLETAPLDSVKFTDQAVAAWAEWAAAQLVTRVTMALADMQQIQRWCKWRQWNSAEEQQATVTEAIRDSKGQLVGTIALKNVPRAEVEENMKLLRPGNSEPPEAA